ncbi:UNVERIFIED_CONTAM: hypothetical protein PYX00_006988 [Menopon gallinae]|uniref:EGF-like domain-containing protein n=1 Tax=Menopon gallinae TaxID=328185 RepID=A0AAW2HH95_9NEOP
MKLDDTRFFHLSRGEWERVPGRPTAWRLRSNSYIWVPSSQIFPKRQSHRSGSGGVFPREFTLLVTLKLDPSKPVQGTLFSLRSRRQQDAYLSLELEAEDRIRIVHAGKNGTQAVIIPMELNDGHWHQLGLALQDDNSVRSFLDCAWVSTDILRRNGLDHPEDADLIIGYLFQGELEQLVIVPNPSAVAQQCSSSRIPLYDPMVEESVKAATTASSRRYKHSRQEEEDAEEDVLGDVKWEVDETADDRFKHFRLKQEKKHEVTLVRSGKSFPSDEGYLEGSGSGITYNETNYEVEWSEWSECSTSCGPGTQTRYSRCVDDGSRLELCMEAGGERTETRSCLPVQCEVPAEEPSADSDLYFSQKGSSNGTRDPQNATEEVAVPMDAYLPKNHTVVAKKHNKHHRSHSGRPDESEAWNVIKKRLTKGKGTRKRCSCLNGGTCRTADDGCDCPEGYWGRRCEKVECQADCTNGGYCLTPNVCTCPSNYAGSRCEDPVCDPPCQNGGTCIKPNVCLCPTRTSGDRCQKFFCRSKCLNGGSCVGPDQCECPHNATGSSCENPICEPPCENGATCSPGNWCLCDSKSYGIRCERRKCEYHPVQEPYTRGFRRLVSKKMETKCEPWNWKSCVRNVPEYQTVYKTFYRTVYKCKENAEEH